MGLRVGVLSNTIWPREWHEGFFRRDGVARPGRRRRLHQRDPLDQAVAEGVRGGDGGGRRHRPGRCVYVGDRLFDDVWGAGNAGMRAVHVPHSTIPPEQHGHTEGEPDAVAHRLAEIPESSAAGPDRPEFHPEGLANRRT